MITLIPKLSDFRAFDSQELDNVIFVLRNHCAFCTLDE